jgi:hypothetical protein
MGEPTDQDWLEQEAFLSSDPIGSPLARALAQPPLEPMPDDFAARVAMLATSQPRLSDERVETLLQYGLVGLLAALGLAFGQRYLMEWWETLPDGADAGLPGWFALVLFCLALSAAPNFFSLRLR